MERPKIRTKISCLEARPFGESPLHLARGPKILFRNVLQNSGAGTRTPDTRIMIPQDVVRKCLAVNVFEDATQGVCTWVCTTMVADEQLAQLCAKWMALPPETKTRLVKAAEGTQPSTWSLGMPPAIEIS